MLIEILSWNINGLKSSLKDNFSNIINNESPDIFCLQEVKCSQLELYILSKYFDKLGYTIYYNASEKKGYSGVLIGTKVKPMNVENGNNYTNDKEGRVVLLDYEKWVLINCYIPFSGGVNSKRYNYRLGFDNKFYNMCNIYSLKKNVILCGDLNVMPYKIDLHKDLIFNNRAGYTQQERDTFKGFLSKGFVDAYRHVNGKNEAYTWYSYQVRKTGVLQKGMRIDYFLLSNQLKSRIVDCSILKYVKGSDHCPIKLKIDMRSYI